MIYTKKILEVYRAHSLDLSSFGTSKVTGMSWMFQGCRVQSLDLSSFDTSKVKGMHNIFHECKIQEIKTNDPIIIKLFTNK